MMRAAKVDHAFGKWSYEYALSHPVVHALFSATNLTSDDVLWIAVPCIVGSCLTLTGTHPNLLNVVRDEVAFVVTGALLEDVLKLCVKRRRPDYAPQRAYAFSVPGEQFSFPSGHALRSGMLITWITSSPHAHWILERAGVSPHRGMVCLWACIAAAGRAVLGKHYPSDCVAGLLIGCVLGQWTQHWLPAHIKLLSAVLFSAVLFGTYTAVPAIVAAGKALGLDLKRWEPALRAGWFFLYSWIWLTSNPWAAVRQFGTPPPRTLAG